MVELIKQLFGGSVSAIEAWVGGVGLFGIISIMASIFYNTYKGKKTKKEIESIKEENKALLEAFIQEHNEELKNLKNALTSDLDNISNMILIEATKSGVDLDKTKQIIDLYKKVVKEEILDTDKIEAEKVEQVEAEQTTQESVNENLNNIDKVLNDYI